MRRNVMETAEFIKIQDMLNILSRKIESLAKEKVVKPPCDLGHLKELPAALAKAQAEFEIADKNKALGFRSSNYADAESNVIASRPFLTKYGLSISHLITQEEDDIWLTTALLHESGERITSRVKIVPEKEGLQGLSAAISYMKRICYAALVGVVAGEGEEENKSTYVKPAYAPKISYNPPKSAQVNQDEVISQDQLDQLHAEFNKYPQILEKIKAALELNSLADIQKSRFMFVLNKARELKELEMEIETKRLAEKK